MCAYVVFFSGRLPGSAGMKRLCTESEKKSFMDTSPKAFLSKSKNTFSSCRALDISSFFLIIMNHSLLQTADVTSGRGHQNDLI